ncbi:Cif family virulence factor [Ferrimonas aestuarii]|uniref:Uncharacterized protein n=1 Tax=Ferrimonas aestuarii TaxID=2569539 RepID=A0A4U1BTJ2_9GAMM|nr:nuclear transport factor 2 family protein [Ferrimonas aestuarii]TKB58670.1 hypothetical protein FCL42_02670 [Ferrimonas aestuarii]
MHHHALLNVIKASQNWINQFNHQNISYCAASYTENAILKVTPLGEFQGRQAIHDFWQGILDSGAYDLHYQQTWIKLIDDDNAHLGANWQMNIGYGVITLEHWQRQNDGHWKLIYDQFSLQTN